MFWFVPVPVGNLEDVTLRSLRILRESPVILCEKTAPTKKLLGLLGVDFSGKKFFHFWGGTKFRLDFLREIGQESVAIVSEAGTPGLSDPGKNLVEIFVRENMEFSVLPGATALVPAVVAAGFPTMEFEFRGFLPQKKWRATAVRKICAAENPVFVYESVHRFEKLFAELASAGFAGRVAVAREISKLHEQLVTGEFAEIRAKIEADEIPVRGEFVCGFRAGKS